MTDFVHSPAICGQNLWVVAAWDFLPVFTFHFLFIINAPFQYGAACLNFSPALVRLTSACVTFLCLLHCRSEKKIQKLWQFLYIASFTLTSPVDPISNVYKFEDRTCFVRNWAGGVAADGWFWSWLSCNCFLGCQPPTPPSQALLNLNEFNIAFSR